MLPLAIDDIGQPRNVLLLLHYKNITIIIIIFVERKVHSQGRVRGSPGTGLHQRWLEYDPNPNLTRQPRNGCSCER